MKTFKLHPAKVIAASESTIHIYCPACGFMHGDGKKLQFDFNHFTDGQEIICQNCYKTFIFKGLSPR